jgi:hypothetical protein
VMFTAGTALGTGLSTIGLSGLAKGPCTSNIFWSYFRCMGCCCFSDNFHWLDSYLYFCEHKTKRT